MPQMNMAAEIFNCRSPHISPTAKYIFLPHSPEGKVVHCCAWKAINEVLQKSRKAINMSVELESANINEETLRWSEGHFSSHSHILIGDLKKQMSFSFFSPFLTYIFWSCFEIMLKCSKNQEGEYNNLFFYPQKLQFWVLVIHLKVQISTFSILISALLTKFSPYSGWFVLFLFFWSYNLIKKVKDIQLI